MGGNYNDSFRSPEVLLRTDNALQMIRRGETEEDLFSGYDFPGSEFSRM